MTGNAQTLFLERYGYVPWKQAPDLPSRWPVLQRLAAIGSPLQLDAVWAMQVMVSVPDAEEEAGLFLCYLFHTARQGHLCVKLTQEGLDPAPRILWSDLVQEDGTIPGGLSLTKLVEDATAGASQLSAYEIMGILVRDGARIYLQRFWQQESLVVEHMMRHLGASVSPSLPQDSIQKHLQTLVVNGTLQSLQAQAIQHACHSPVTLLTGGPGTGKTHTASHLIEILWKHAPHPQHFRIVAAAPTGKAAANLGSKLKKLSNSPISCKTLHALLGVHRRGKRNQAYLEADLIVVDESSMIDVEIMGALLAGIKTGARIVLIGDSDQLPAVEAGGVFADCVSALRSSCVINLEQCLRTEFQEIIQLATHIREGNLDALSHMSHGPVQFHEWTPHDDKKVQQALEKHMEPLRGHNCSTPQEMLHLLSQRRVLTTLRDGPWGVDQLNKRLAKMVSQRSGPQITPILITVNDYAQGLFNGDIGVLVRDGYNAYALFGDRELPAATLPRYEPAYALSVHKSQGSEFDHVLLLLPPRSGVFGREMLYTAATRARHSLHIWSSSDLFESLLKRGMHRLSGLPDRLHM